MLTLGGLFAGSLCPCCSPTLFLAPQVLYLAQDGQEQVVLPKAAILDGVSILEFAYPIFFNSDTLFHRSEFYMLPSLAAVRGRFHSRLFRLF